jgi:hypothetical protein
VNAQWLRPISRISIREMLLLVALLCFGIGWFQQRYEAHTWRGRAVSFEYILKKDGWILTYDRENDEVKARSVDGKTRYGCTCALFATDASVFDDHY